MQTITYFNPLQPTATKSEICNYTHSSQIRKEFQYDAIAFELVIAKNNQIIIEDCEIIDTDIVSVMVRPRGGGGGGKQILTTVAMIAVVVASGGLAASAVYGLAGMGFGTLAGVLSTGIGFSLLTAGIVMAGGMLVNAILPPNIPDTPSLSNSLESQSQTYSWSQAVNTTNQGDAMPRLFGTFRVSPRLIAKHIDSIGDKQYFNGLYLVNDGLSYYVGDVKINDEDISNFLEANYEVNYGLTNQQIIPQFDDISNDKNVSKKLSYATYSETSTDGDAVSTITATLVFPRGLYYANDDGSLGNNTVKVVVEYSTNEISWTQFGDDTIVQSWKYWSVGYDNIWREYTSIEGSATGYSQTYAPIGAKYIKSTGSKFIIIKWYQSPYTYVYNYTTITNNTSSTFRKTFSIGYLPANKYYVRAKFYVNPTTGSRYSSDCYFEYLTEKTSYDFTYPGQTLLSIRALATDQLSGGMPTITCIASSGSSNPSLIVQAILEECGVTPDRFSSKFDEWETYCDDNNLECNIYFDATTDVRQAINYVSTIGRASVLQFGSKFDVIIDKAEIIPTQGFTLGMGNILKDTFKQSFLPLKDRANLVEVSYYDVENDYQKTALQLGEENYDSVDESSKISVNLIGCVNRGKAIEHAKLLLNYNRYLTQTFTFQADIDSLVCKVGDIVRISHDLPQYGFSGRIISSTTTNAVLDRDVTIESGKSYYLQVRRSSTNEILEIPLQTIVGTSSTVTFTSAISLALNHLDNYSFGEINKTDVKARVLNIRTTSEFLRELTCIEYNESVYDLTAEPIVHNFSSFNLSNLRINDYIRYAQDRSIETVVNIAWSGSSIYYTVTANNKSYKVYDNIIDIVGLTDGKTYLIEVKDNYGNKISSNYTVVGKLAPPSDVDTVSVSEIGNVFSLTWTHENIEIDFQEYVIYLNGSEIGRTKTTSFEYFSKGLDTKIFTVKVMDTSKKYSDGISISIIAEAPDGISSISATNTLEKIVLTWNYTKPQDFARFGLAIASKVYYTQDTYFEYQLATKDNKFTVWVEDSAGNISTSNSFSYSVSNILDNVTNIVEYYDSNKVAFTWDKDANINIKYQVRDSSVWSIGSIAQESNNNIFYPSREGEYSIKKYYKNAYGYEFFSATAEVFSVEGDLTLTKNVIATFDERALGWSGTKDNVNTASDPDSTYDGALTIDSATLLDDITSLDLIPNFDLLPETGSDTKYGVYTSTNVITLSSIQSCYITSSLNIIAKDLGNLIDYVVNFDDIADFDGDLARLFKIQKQISISNDGTTWGDWKNQTNADYVGKAFKFRVEFYSYKASVKPYLQQYKFSVDMPDRIDKGTITTSATYYDKVHATPFNAVPQTVCTIVDAQEGDSLGLSNESVTGFRVFVKNGGSYVSRVINYLSKGY